MNTMKECIAALKRLFPNQPSQYAAEDFRSVAPAAVDPVPDILRDHLGRIVLSDELYDQHAMLLAFHFGVTPRRPVPPVAEDLVTAVRRGGLSGVPVADLLHLAFDVGALRRLQDERHTSPFWVDLMSSATGAGDEPDDPPSHLDVVPAGPGTTVGGGQPPASRPSRRRLVQAAGLAAGLLVAVGWVGYLAVSGGGQGVVQARPPRVVASYTPFSPTGQAVKDANPKKVYSDDPFKYAVAVEDPLAFGWLYGIDRRKATLLRPLERRDGRLATEYRETFDSVAGYEYFVVIQAGADWAAIGDKARASDWLSNAEIDRLQEFGGEDGGDERAVELIRAALRRAGVTGPLDVYVDCRQHVAENRP